MELNQLMQLLNGGNSFAMVAIAIVGYLLYSRGFLGKPKQPEPTPTPTPSPQPVPPASPNDRPILNVLGSGRLGPLLDALGIPALGRGGVFQSKAEPDPVEQREKLNTFYSVLEVAAESPDYAAAILETAERIRAARQAKEQK
jgi:hypothetical protein